MEKINAYEKMRYALMLLGGDSLNVKESTERNKLVAGMIENIVIQMDPTDWTDLVFAIEAEMMARVRVARRGQESENRFYDRRARIIHEKSLLKSEEVE